MSYRYHLKLKPFDITMKDGKILYADDDHLSVDVTILQAQYFAYQLLEE